MEPGEAPAAPATANLLLSPTDPHPLEWAQIPAPTQLREFANPKGMQAGEPGTKSLGYWGITKAQETVLGPMASPILSLGSLNNDYRPWMPAHTTWGD